jgi:hypothetical protein
VCHGEDEGERVVHNVVIEDVRKPSEAHLPEFDENDGPSIRRLGDPSDCPIDFVREGLPQALSPALVPDPRLFVLADREAMEPDVHAEVLNPGRSASIFQVGPRHRGRGITQRFLKATMQLRGPFVVIPIVRLGRERLEQGFDDRRALLLRQVQGRFEDLSALIIHPNAPHRVEQVLGSPDDT